MRQGNPPWSSSEPSCANSSKPPAESSNTTAPSTPHSLNYSHISPCAPTPYLMAGIPPGSPHLQRDLELSPPRPPNRHQSLRGPQHRQRGGECDDDGAKVVLAGVGFRLLARRALKRLPHKAGQCCGRARAFRSKSHPMKPQNPPLPGKPTNLSPIKDVRNRHFCR